MVTIESPGLPPVKYCDLNEEKIQEIFEHHVLKGEPRCMLMPWPSTDGEGPLPSSSSRNPKVAGDPFLQTPDLWALRNRGLIDAETH